MQTVLDRDFFEWPEDNNETDSQIAISKIMEILADRISSEITGASPHYFLIPHPIRNKEHLLDRLNSDNSPTPKTPHYEFIEFGYKSRGCAFLFDRKEGLSHAIPIFFQHKPEGLIIGAMDAVSGRVSNIKTIRRKMENIMGLSHDDTANTNYVGLAFECDRLIEIF
ncbi:hypothetical protein [Marinobacter sp. CA1]|uniref:hypothetical protein n=1 Tax=Marinobacter sp. CA1 TaxID=2817656 RepID=UPI001D087B87|nr:hypothetical protein [Marinobacter sp. CA1]UDL06127.1 hypothetical protein J2887_05040 [Marinobacter sp. CA1]